MSVVINYPAAGGGSGGGGGGGTITSVNGQTGPAVTITPANINAVSVAAAWAAATNLAPQLVSGTPLSGTYAGVNVVQNTSPGVTTLTPAIDAVTTINFGDFMVFGTGGVNTWTSIAGGGSYFGVFASTGALQTAYPAASNLGCTALVGASAPYAFYLSNGTAWIAPGTPSAPTTTLLFKGDGAGGLAVAVPGTDYTPPPALQRAVPAGALGSWTFGANGALNAGNQPAGSVGATLTFSATSGSGVTCTSSATTFTSAAANVGQVITLDGGKQFTITAFTSTTVVVGTISGGTLSTTTFTAWALSWPLVWANGPANPYSSGVWLYFPANSITASNTAGMYWTVMASPTVGTVYNNTYVPGGSYVPPGSPTAFAAAAGATTTNSIAATLPVDSVTIAANYLGRSGRIRTTVAEHNSQDAGAAKQIVLALNGNAFNGPLSYNANSGSNSLVTVFNTGATNRQYGCFADIAGGNQAPSIKNVDTTAATTWTTGVIVGAVADWIIIDLMVTELIPGF